MPETKTCEVCGGTFERKRTRTDAMWQYQRTCSISCGGKLRWSEGRNAKIFAVPCRICGSPTRYRFPAYHPLYALMHCQRTECAEQSRKLKNERVRAGSIKAVAEGRNPAATSATWKGIPKVSPEEALLIPWFVAMGWVPQYNVNTGAHSYHVPRYYQLDFALPDKRLYVEIDGSSHRTRATKDAERDAKLAELGWHGLRIPASQVSSDLSGTQAAIQAWIVPTVL